MCYNFKLMKLSKISDPQININDLILQYLQFKSKQKPMHKARAKGFCLFLYS